MTKMLSPHFALEEFTLSQTAVREGIPNAPDAGALRNLQALADVLEQVRSALGGKSVSISSGYRSRALNTAIGGSSTSAHMTGCAADLTVPAYGTVLQTARAIAACGVPFDQIIYEYGRWVHFGLAAPGATPRRELLSIGSQKKYVSGLTTQC